MRVVPDPYLPGHGDLRYTVEHYDLALDYRLTTNRLDAVATLRVVAREATDTLRATYQRLADLANAHGMPVDFAEVVMPSWLADLVPAAAADEEAEEF